jgi:hypothetical protein
MLGRLLLLVGVLLLLAAPLPARARTPAPDTGSVLLINQRSPRYQAESDHAGQHFRFLLGHFTPSVTAIDEAEYTAGQVFGYDRIVFVGNGSPRPLPRALLDDLARTRRPVLWIGSGIEELPVDVAARYGFAPGEYSDQDLATWVEYQGERYPARVTEYGRVRVSAPSTRVLATYVGSGGRTPYILRGHNLWYVNGLPVLGSEYPDPAHDAPALILADSLHAFFGNPLPASRKAVIRLEDVSVHIDPDRIIEATDYLYSQGIPFAVGVIPAQRFRDGSIVSLRERPEFVKALRYAQDRGGTIILHGYHHTFGSGEDYEFWDIERNAPLEGESWGMYARKVEDGIRILRNVGLEPRMWETPHYAASPLAYEVFSHYFSHAVENRDPVGWMPYPGGPDEYGQVLIPEALGYINPSQGMTVEAQLRRANLLKIVRDSWAVGFYHPVNIPLTELKSLTTGLRKQGYTFADLRLVPSEVRYDYQPGRWDRFVTWFLVDVNPRATHLLWLMFAMAALFLVRLREQWRPVSAPSP